jgi:hypothetical protein
MQTLIPTKIMPNGKVVVAISFRGGDSLKRVLEFPVEGL